MEIFPAIDLISGQVVRLLQGDYDKVTVFEKTPLEIALSYQESGAKYLHLVDLDGAKEGKGMNDMVISEIANKTNLMVEVGGGIRTILDIEKKLQMGVSRVILGSKALDINFVKSAIEKFGANRIVVGLDAKNGYIAISGWTEVTKIKAIDYVMELKNIGLTEIIYTDIQMDGMMKGPNFEETRTLIEKSGMNVIASGGVSRISDIKRLRDCHAFGAIVGKALLTNQMDLKEAIKEGTNVK